MSTLKQFASQPPAARNLTIGTALGPFTGVWFSMVAIQWAQVGIASTLMALVPIFMLPIGYFVFKERFGWQVIAGTIVAVVGVALLFLALAAGFVVTQRRAIATRLLLGEIHRTGIEQASLVVEAVGIGGLSLADLRIDEDGKETT